MADENSGTMNLDLNLGPSSPPDTDPRPVTLTSDNLNFEELIQNRREIQFPQSLRSRIRQRLRSFSSSRQPPNNIANRVGDALQTGEASEINDDVAKECKKEEVSVEKESKKEVEEKGSDENGSFFDCNICLDLSSDPVLTCCGHLFCWPCLHQWLNVHSDTKECPVCKGSVTDKNLTPIYGRGCDNTHEQKDDNIPDRPQAQRVESWRQTVQRNDPMDEMIRRLESIDSYRNYLTSRGMRQEEATVSVTPDEVIEIDLTRSTSVRSDADARRVEAYLRRSHTYRSAPTAELATITQRLIASYLRYSSLERTLGQPVLDDRDRDTDSVSSIAAVIHSESQVDIDSNVSLSTSSSRRRVDGSRVSDVDSEDSRAPTRRRLN